jgi:hypothetical protein
MTEYEEFPDKIMPGAMFEVDGKEILTPEGRMSGKVTLQVASTNGDWWNIVIFGSDRPEWEWLLGKVIQMKSSRVTELFNKRPL